MADKEGPYYYRAVPGSRELVTSSDRGDDSLEKIENAPSGDGPSPLFKFKGEWLGGARFESGLVIPASVFDSLAPHQSPLEQTVYLHLFRLSYGQARNWCRVGKREIGFRARVSDRRLNVALDGLVRKGHIKPLHRNTKGTLYRVYLPSEILDSEREKGIVLGEMVEDEPVDEPDWAVTDGEGGEKLIKRERPLESPLNEERFADASGIRLRGPSVNEMAAWFFKARGRKPKPRDHQLAVTVLTGLMEDGFSRQEIQKALEWHAENLPDENNLDKLPYFITKALE